MKHSVVRRVRFFALVVGSGSIVAGFSACSDATGPDDDLGIARRQWSNAGPDAYSVTLGRGCFCVQEVPSPVVVTVRNGIIESRRYETTGAPVSAAYEGGFPDIDGLFDLIEEALEKADSVTVTYHATLGYPEQIFIDYYAGAADDELSFIVTDLTVQ